MWRCLIGVIGSIFLVVGPAVAGSLSSDGNWYYSYRSPFGGGYLNGFNFNTGRSWFNNYDGRGSSHGLDGRGNFWQYNRSTGTYFNFGTGEMRYGTGPNRRRW